MSIEQIKILVVDDLPAWRATLSGLLRDDHYETQETDSIASALQLLKSNKFDLAVIDIRLDESNEENEDGLNLAEQIKQLWPNTKVIMITGYGTTERLKRAMQPDPITGKKLADDYLPKAETGKLIQSVKCVLA